VLLAAAAQEAAELHAIIRGARARTPSTSVRGI
jgi:hypothetical protein